MRPSDLIVLVLLALIALRGRILVNRSVLTIWVLLGSYVLVVFMTTSLKGQVPVVAFKALALALIPFVIHEISARYNPVFNYRVLLVALSGFAAVSAEMVLFVLSHLGTFDGNVWPWLFRFWNGLFGINPFGPDDLEVRGLSFRNSFASGAIALLLFVFAFMEPGRLKSLFMGFLVLAILLAFSRSGWLTLAYFGVLLGISSNARRTTLGLAIAAGAVVVFSDGLLPWLDAVETRVLSESGRLADYPIALGHLLRHPLLGDVAAQKVDGVVIVHNAILATGARQGALAMALAGAICAVIAYWGIRFALRVINGSGSNLDIVGATAAFLCILRMNVSAAGETLFSLGAWCAFGMLLVGITTLGTQRTVGVALPAHRRLSPAELSQ